MEYTRGKTRKLSEVKVISHVGRQTLFKLVRADSLKKVHSYLIISRQCLLASTKLSYQLAELQNQRVWYTTGAISTIRLWMLRGAVVGRPHVSSSGHLT